MKKISVYILIFMSSFISACSHQTIGECVKSYNESDKNEELLKGKTSNIYYPIIRDNLDTNLIQVYLGGLNYIIKNHCIDQSLSNFNYVIVKSDSTNSEIFQKFLDSSSLGVNNFFLLKIFSNNQRIMIYQGVLIEKKNFCKYLYKMSKLSERKKRLLGTPSDDIIDTKKEEKIKKLVLTYFIVVYRNGKYEYIIF